MGCGCLRIHSSWSIQTLHVIELTDLCFAFLNAFHIPPAKPQRISGRINSSDKIPCPRRPRKCERLPLYDLIVWVDAKS